MGLYYRRFTVAVGLATLIYAQADAGVLSAVKGAGGAIGVGVAGLVLAYVMKRIPNEKLYKFFEKQGKRLGSIVTLGLNKWKWSAPVYEKTIEPWVVDAIQNIGEAGIKGFIAGLRSDNNAGRKDS
uniref:Uncharacterized protein n=1 Tax=viral metagenome TaxID=1070528 RepID=A0A6M3LC35_9ZZZZ